MIFEQLIYKEVFSKPTSYAVWNMKKNFKAVYSNFWYSKGLFSIKTKHQQMFFENLKKNKKQFQKTKFVKISCHLIKILF